MTTLLAKKETKDWVKQRLTEIAKEQDALRALLLEEDTQMEKEPAKEKEVKNPSAKTKAKGDDLTAVSFLKFPDLGLKGSILRVLKENKRKKFTIPEISEEILTIATDDPNYKKVAGSIRQTLRIGAKNDDWKKQESGGRTTYGI